MTIDPRELPLVDTPPIANWSENYCFQINCPDAGVGFFLHASRQDFNRDLWRDVMVTQMQGKHALVWKGYGKGAHDAGPGGAQLRFACRESFKRWTLTFDGAARLVPAAAMAPGSGAALSDGRYVPVRMTIEAEADGAVWELSKEMSGQSWANQHYQQSIKTTGELVVDGKTFSLQGVGARDHSRGPRNWAGLGSHGWAIGGFPGGRRFIVIALDGRPNPLENQVRIAMISDRNGSYPAEIVDVTLAKSAHDGGGLRYSMRLRSPAGEEVFEAEQHQITTLAFAPTNEMVLGAMTGGDTVAHCFHGPTRFVWNGEVCHGYTERSFAL